MTNDFSFKIEACDKSTAARAGSLQTPHGTINTPTLMPVGTRAAVKALSPDDLQTAGVQAVMANTYHLFLRPGHDLIYQLGGLHKFMNWQKPLMTDSGGFQVFSLGIALEHGVGKTASIFGEEVNNKPKSKPVKSRMNKIDEGGVTFYSHIDGQKMRLTPELSIQIQQELGADLILAFDDLESPRYSYEQTQKSLELSNRWEERSRMEFLKIQKRQLLFGITHGGQFEDLRRDSAKFVDHNFDAIALGGAHVSKKSLYQCIKWTVEEVDDQKPRHLLGIGEVDDLFEAVERGIDLFDCVSPTRRARNGSLYISPQSGGNKKNSFCLAVTNAQFARSSDPIDKNCACPVCLGFSRAYLKHLFNVGELLAYHLASLHNLFFIENLTVQIRLAIMEGRFDQLKKAWIQ